MVHLLSPGDSCCGGVDCSSLFGLPQSDSDSVLNAFTVPDVSVFQGSAGSLVLGDIHKQGFPATVTYSSTTVATYDPVAIVTSYRLEGVGAGSEVRTGGLTGNAVEFSDAQLSFGFPIGIGQTITLRLTSRSQAPDQEIQVTTPTPSAGITAALTHEVTATISQAGQISATHSATATVVQSNGSTFFNETFSQAFTVPFSPCVRFRSTSGGVLNPRFGQFQAAGDYTQDQQASLS